MSRTPGGTTSKYKYLVILHVSILRESNLSSRSIFMVWWLSHLLHNMPLIIISHTNMRSCMGWSCVHYLFVLCIPQCFLSHVVQHSGVVSSLCHLQPQVWLLACEDSSAGWWVDTSTSTIISCECVLACTQ